MTDAQKPAGDLAKALQERIKELNCLYAVESVLQDDSRERDSILDEVARLIPDGWQYVDDCEVDITLGDKVYRSSDFEPTRWVLTEPIRNGGIGSLRIFYSTEKPAADSGPFLVEEVRLARSLADRLGQFLQLRANGGDDHGDLRKHDWQIVLDHVRRTDSDTYLRLSRRMLNLLCSYGVQEAQQILASAYGISDDDAQEGEEERNLPRQKTPINAQLLLDGLPFDLATRRMPAAEITKQVQYWLQEEQIVGLKKVLDNPRSPLPEVVDQVRRHRPTLANTNDMLPATTASLTASLIQRFLTDQLDFVHTARQFLDFDDFAEMADHIVYPAGSHGMVGGKAAGVVLAQGILRKAAKARGVEDLVRFPRSFYLTTDGMTSFIAHNDLEDIFAMKYMEIDEIRREYPNIQQLMKNSPFPPDMINGLTAVLDELGERPIIVRSSSLLEDRAGTAFSGKYKSLFLANQGTKKERLAALLDAIAEIYASTFGPDPVAYRQERHLLEFKEQMGILIQEVVGKQVGRWFLPSFAGVAFSRTEFRWSPRIQQKDGLVRLVPGLGTRAVDRTRDDYPVLAVPGKPDLRVNVAVDEIVRYAPNYADVIDLQDNTFRTVKVADLVKEMGPKFPGFRMVFSLLNGDTFRQPLGMWSPDDGAPVVTFEGLRGSKGILSQIEGLMNELEKGIGRPVDLEFAHDGEHLYLLQCRVQSQSSEESPAAIPRDLKRGDIVFNANRHVANGWIPDISHIVYVDPEAYAAITTREDLLRVGKAVGRLNKLLPKRRFILVGPGRWGSRGDIKMGVSVTYADINNAAMLVEVARRRGGYVPEVSFGTHFFQDLVEAKIRYLPLYPDDDDIIFNEPLLTRSPSLLTELAPEFTDLDKIVRVIDVPANFDDRHLRVLMNADLNEAVAVLVDDEEPRGESRPRKSKSLSPVDEDHWRWRQHMAKSLAKSIEPGAMGVKALYLFGSVKNGTAGPGSDIDLLVHLDDEIEDRRLYLTTFLSGWSEALAQMNYIKTGYTSEGLLDVHYITDADIEARTSFACKIGAVTDAARPLVMAEPKIDA
jgi:pyruvate, water dikinase